jgi:hypothetical protein
MSFQDRMDQHKAELKDLVKAKLAEEILKLDNFDTIMQIRQAVEIYARIKI